VSFKFRYRSPEETAQAATTLGLSMGFSTDYQRLGEGLTLGQRTIPNRLVVQPMEGFDGVNQGEPGELTFRRYLRYAKGGAGIIWFEATAILPEARTNPQQLVLNSETVDAFARLVDATKEAAWAEFRHEPFCILQLTHSGRFSKPAGQRQPIIAVHDRVFDAVVGVDAAYPVLTDEELEWIRDTFGEASRLAYQAGFDGVDIKACHRYLLSELLAAKERTGLYGGSYERRTGLLKEIVALVKNSLPTLTVAVRLNATDLVDTANSWGVSPEHPGRPDLGEPLRLVTDLAELGVGLLNITAGTPYYNPHVNRPYDQPVKNGYAAPEHPLQGVDRLFNLAAAIQTHLPAVPVVGSGYSWLRQFGGAAAAYNLSHGRHQLAGFGRQAFAYPGFARDLLSGEGMRPEKTCITCSKCSQLMQVGSSTGCVVRDARVYAPIFQRAAQV
jgi:2,4-dienoyl-CoA reductase (NADPH2)